MGKCAICEAWLSCLQSVVGEGGLERVPTEPLKHPALISALGDPTPGNLHNPSRLWWSSEDLIIQRHDSQEWNYSLWEPKALHRHEALRSTLSDDGKHLEVSTYEKATKTSFLKLYTFPAGELVWETEVKAYDIAFLPGVSWLAAGSVGRPPNEITYTLYKVDRATGEVLKEYKISHPRKAGTGLIGGMEGLAASKTSVFFATKERTFSSKKETAWEENGFSG